MGIAPLEMSEAVALSGGEIADITAKGDKCLRNERTILGVYEAGGLVLRFVDGSVIPHPLDKHTTQNRYVNLQ